MSSYAEVDCVLKVNVQCEACRGKLHEVLSSISGEYSVTVDSEGGLANITGQMEPNILLSALSRNGKHAELKSLKLRSPKPKGAYDNSGYSSSNGLCETYCCGSMPNGSQERRAMPQGMRHETNQSYNHPFHGSNYGHNGAPHSNNYPFQHCTQQ